MHAPRVMRVQETLEVTNAQLPQRYLRAQPQGLRLQCLHLRPRLCVQYDLPVDQIGKIPVGAARDDRCGLPNCEAPCEFEKAGRNRWVASTRRGGEWDCALLAVAQLEAGFASLRVRLLAARRGAAAQEARQAGQAADSDDAGEETYRKERPGERLFGNRGARAAGIGSKRGEGIGYRRRRRKRQRWR